MYPFCVPIQNAERDTSGMLTNVHCVELEPTVTLTMQTHVLPVQKDKQPLNKEVTKARFVTQV